MKTSLPTTLSLLACVGATLSGALKAQTIDAFAPDPSGGPYAEVQTLAIQLDGKILLGGSFSTIAGQPRPKLGRVEFDGGLDASFQLPGDLFFNPSILSVRGDGLITSDIGGGSRFLPDGTRELSLDAYYMQAMATFPDGRIVFADAVGPGQEILRRLNTDGSLDPTFEYEIPGGSVNALAAEPGGAILVGGSLDTSGMEDPYSLTRLLPNGTVDPDFHDDVDGFVANMVLQPDGKIVVGGGFTAVDGVPRLNLARLNPDGTLDESFSPGGVDGIVRSLALQADGGILVGGDFISLGGQPCTDIGRLNADGTFDASFSPGTDNFVWALAIEQDGNVLVGGRFSTIGGEPRNNLARILNTGPATQSLTTEGSTVTWLRGGTSPEVWITTFEISEDGIHWAPLGTGTRIAGGWQLSDVSIPEGSYVRARGHVTGGNWNASSWVVESIAGAPLLVSQPLSQTQDASTPASFSVSAIGSDPLQYQWRKDGEELVDGVNIAGSQSATLSVLHSLHADEGTYDVIVSNESGSVTSLVAILTVNDPVILQQLSGPPPTLGNPFELSIVVAGTPPVTYAWTHDGTAVPGATAATLAIQQAQLSDAGDYEVTAVNAYGSVTASFNVTVTPAVVDDFNPHIVWITPGDPPVESIDVKGLAILPTGDFLVGGLFIEVDGWGQAYLAQFSEAGEHRLGFNPFPYFPVNRIGLLPDGRILAASDGFNGTIIRYFPGGGESDPSFAIPPGALDWAPNTIAVQLNGGVVFAQQQGPECRIGRLFADGMPDDSFGKVADGWVSHLAMQRDGKVLVGGSFYDLSGTPRTSLARLNTDGSVDSTFNPTEDWGPFGGWIEAMAVQGDGKIIVTGGFDSLGGKPSDGIARLNPDGTADASFTASLPAAPGGYANSIAIQADGKIILGGAFDSLNGSVAKLGRLLPDGSTDETFHPAPDNEVTGLALDAAGRLLVSGYFTTVAGQPRLGMARLLSSGPATESLTYYGSAITWLRGGTSPDVWATTFELSTDGATWTPLGEGMPIPGGWRLTGVSAPVGARIRARGFIASGYANASRGIVESTLTVPIQILVGSLVTQPFSFSLSGPAGQSVVIEGSTNFQNWIPLITNTVNSEGLLLFSDPEAGQNSQRYYRGRVQ